MAHNAKKRNYNAKLYKLEKEEINELNNMGGTISDNCNNLAKDIWKFCMKEKVCISAEHIPGCQNYMADFMSRSFNDNTE